MRTQSSNSGKDPCLLLSLSPCTQTHHHHHCHHDPEGTRKSQAGRHDSTLLLLFSRSVVSDSFATPWTAPRQASLSFTISWSLLKPMSTESVMPTNHLILCRPLLPLPSIFPSIRVFFNESVLHISTLLPMKTAENAEGKTETEEA